MLISLLEGLGLCVAWGHSIGLSLVMAENSPHTPAAPPLPLPYSPLLFHGYTLKLWVLCWSCSLYGLWSVTLGCEGTESVTLGCEGTESAFSTSFLAIAGLGLG